MRDIDPDVWVNYLLKQIKDVDNCIIDDIRYQNEVDACKKSGFTFIYLTIPKQIQIKRIKRVYPDNYMDHIQNINHVSETNNLQLENFIEINTSNRTIEDVKYTISRLLTTH